MKTHIVKEGENVVDIARLYGVKITDLVDANNLGTSLFLTPGMELLIPITVPSGFTYYIVQSGDNLFQISQKYNLTAKQLADLNGLELSEYIYPNQKLIVPKEGTAVYISQEGDRLSDLANILNVTRDELIYYNPNLYLLPDQIIAYRSSNGLEKNNNISNNREMLNNNELQNND